MFGPDRVFGVRAPYEQHASDAGGGAGATDDNASSDAAGGAGSTPDGATAGDPGTGQSTPPSTPTFSDDDVRDRDAYRQILRDFGGKLPTPAEIARLRDTLATATGIRPGEQPPDPREARIREGLLRSVPELKEILELRDYIEDIRALRERRPVYDASASAHFDSIARAAKDELHNSFAAAVLGPGKSAADLSEQARKDIAYDFGMWLKGDDARAARFERGEGKALVGEFLNRSRQLWAPVQRETVAGHVARMPSAPSEGSFGTAPAGNRPVPAGQGAPQSNDDRLDAAVDRAFEQITNAR